MSVRANPLGLIARPSMVEEETLGTAIITVEHAMVHAGRAFSQSGVMTISNNQTGAIQISPPANVAASVTINMTATTSDLTYTAVNYGTEGNSITVTHTNPGAANRTLAVTVVGTNITVYLGTNAGGAINSSAAQVKVAVNAHAEASLLVTCEDEGAGSGTVNAIAQTSLAGGAYYTEMHLKTIKLINSVGPLTASLMENYTIDSDAAVLTPINRNRRSSNTSKTVLKSKANCTVTAGTGPLTVDSIFLPATSVALGGESYEEWELYSGKNYVLAIPNTAGSSTVIKYSLFWYELQQLRA